MKITSAFRKLMQRVHNDERGAVSLETILIIGAVAIPVLIVIVKYGWPRIRDYFFQGMDNLEDENQRTIQGDY